MVPPDDVLMGAGGGSSAHWAPAVMVGKKILSLAVLLPVLTYPGKKDHGGKGQASEYLPRLQ